MGWIRDKSGKPRGDTLLRLWKHDELNVFIMDNHLAALFAWLGCLNPDDNYRLFHIDHHWDMTDMPDEDIYVLVRSDFSDLGRLDEFTDLRSTQGGGDFPLVDFTNYISPLPQLRRNLKISVLGADQDSYTAEIENDPRFLKVSVPCFFDTVDTLIAMPFKGRTLFNIDIDFLFKGMHEYAERVYDDGMIDSLVTIIRPNFDKEQDIITIALSPEFCGLGNAEKICQQICEKLSIDHPF